MNGSRKDGDVKSRLELDSPCSSEDGDQLTLLRVRQRSLVDAMEDEESPIASKRRRRMSISDALIGSFHTLRHNGSQLSSLVGDTLDSFTKTKTRDVRGLDDESENGSIDMKSILQGASRPDKQPLIHSSFMNLLKEKTEHAIRLQQELTQIKSQNAQLHIENAEIKNSERRIFSRMQVFKHDVRTSAKTIASARKEADEAKATSSNLAARLHALQGVIQETKDASQTLLQERDSLNQKVRSVEKQYIQSQAALAQSIAKQNNTQKINDDLILSVESLQRELEGLNSKIEKLKNETTRWQKISSNLRMQDAKQQNRIKHLEEQLQHTGILNEDTNTKVQEPRSSIRVTNPDVLQHNDSHFGKENETPATKCSICFKDAVGMMRKCQCGQKECNSHAHSSCLNRVTAGPSVSHPGTPAPRLPIILCSLSKKKTSS